jgi:hypothetical protein
MPRLNPYANKPETLLLTRTQARAALGGISVELFQRLISDGDIRIVPLGRQHLIPYVDLYRWVDSAAIPANVIG